MDTRRPPDSWTYSASPPIHHTSNASPIHPSASTLPPDSPTAEIKPPTVAVVIGGDGRQMAVAERLADNGCSIRLVALGNAQRIPRGARLYADLHKAAEGAHRLVLPLPATRDGRQVWCPLDLDCHITLEEVAACMTPDTHLFGGRLPTDYLTMLRARGLTVTDYYEDEALQIRNAHITAEGALMTAMELTDHTIKDAHVALLGYGRIGQILSRLLVAMGARVTVYARRTDQLAWASANGCRPCKLEKNALSLLSLCEGYDVIFNTIPARILERTLLQRMSSSTLLIELASAPGGIDPGDAREAVDRSGLRIVWAPSLPGRYASVTAGHVIADCIMATPDDLGDREEASARCSFPPNSQ